MVENKIELSEIGEIVKTEWLKSPEIWPDMNHLSDAFERMPDHFTPLFKLKEIPAMNSKRQV